MAANVCPACKGAVMSYGRFLREAEPYRISNCGSCGIRLRRSPMVYGLLLVMGVVLAAVAIPLADAVVLQRISVTIGIGLGILLLVCWTLLTNWLGYFLIRWVPVKEE